MYKRLFGVLLGAIFLWGTTLAVGQCGATIKRTIQTCGGHCNSVVRLTCTGIGTNCEDGTGEFGFGCCGLMLIEPGGCGLAQATQPKGLPSSTDLVAFKDALALRRRPLPGQSHLIIASCGANKNAFSEWLEVRLQQKR